MFYQFLDTNAALLMHSEFILKKINIKGYNIRVGWGKIPLFNQEFYKQLLMMEPREMFIWVIYRWIYLKKKLLMI